MPCPQQSHNAQPQLDRFMYLPFDLVGNALREKGMKQLLRAEWIKQVTHRVFMC